MFDMFFGLALICSLQRCCWLSFIAAGSAGSVLLAQVLFTRTVEDPAVAIPGNSIGGEPRCGAGAGDILGLELVKAAYMSPH